MSFPSQTFTDGAYSTLLPSVAVKTHPRTHELKGVNPSGSACNFIYSLSWPVVPFAINNPFIEQDDPPTFIPVVSI